MTTRLRRLAAALSTLLIVSALFVVGGEESDDAAFASESSPTVGRFTTTQITPQTQSGSAHCWRGFAFKTSDIPTVVTGLIGGSIFNYSAGSKEFHGALYSARLDGQGNLLGAGEVLVEVVFRGDAANQEVFFSSASDVVFMSDSVVNNRLSLTQNTWYFLMQGSVVGSPNHHYVQNLNVNQLLDNNPRFSSWLPESGAFFGECNQRASANSTKNITGAPSAQGFTNFSNNPDQPAIGFLFETTASGKPTVATTDAPLSGELTDRGGAPVNVLMRYSTSISGTNCTTDPSGSSCVLSGTIVLDTAETGYEGAVPYVFSAPTSDLQAGTVYYYQARATNDAGTVDGVIKKFTTPPAPGTPTISSVAPENSALTIEVVPEAEGTGVGPTTTYRYRIQPTTDNIWSGDAGWVNRVPAGLGPIRIEGLDNGTEYRVQVQAVGAGVLGGTSNVATGTPEPTPPGSPTGLELASGDQQLSVSFVPPSDDGGSLVSNYEYSVDDGVSWVAVDPPSTSSPLTISGLENGTPYTVRLRALNSAGVGTASDSAVATPMTTPGAPTGLALTPGDQQLSVSFVPPSDDGGSPISNFEYSVDDGVSWVVVDPPSTSSPLTISGLQDRTPYTVRLRAVNSVGEGAPSSSATATTIVAPGVPTGISITPGNQQVIVSFSPPADDGGSSITEYQYSLNAGETWVSISPPFGSSQFIIPSLTNGVSYSVIVRAANIVGVGEASISASGTPVAPTVAPRPRAADEPPALGLPAIPTRPPGVTATGPVSNTPPPPISGPVLSPGVTPTPPAQPTARVGTRLIPIATEVNSPSALTLRSSSVAVGVAIPETVGGVRQQPGGSTELEVRSGGQTTLQGGGVLPGSTVQVFMPLQGTNAKQVAQIQADATGAFNGNAVFATQRTEPPLPIGRQVLQIVSVDDTGQQVVMEMAVVIAQPAPAPEFDRTIDALPNLQPGSFYGMSAGEPTDLVVRTDRVQRETVIEGGDFSMSVRFGEQEIPAGEDASEAGATLTFVRDQVATVSGGGFMPGTRADVWLFSDPTLMTSVDIDDNGEFAGDIVVDGRQITVGEHTLQLQGVGTDGYVRAANLGVIVNDGDEPVATADVASSFAWWFWIIGLVALLAVAAIAFWVYRRANAAV